MTGPELQTANTLVRLIEPDIERDAELGVEWMAGVEGYKTQALMGVAERNIHAHTIEEEEHLVASFIASADEVVWMIEYAGDVVGVVEVHLKERESVPAPSVHIMLGDPAARGKGVGFAALNAAVAWMQAERGEEIIFTRALTRNQPSRQLLAKVGFEEDGEPYVDGDGLEWQGFILRQD